MGETIEKTKAINDVSKILARSDKAINEAKKYLNDNGVEYNLEEWLTVKRYCERFKINDTHIVSNWIRRGIIPPENIREIEELNGLKLIKAVPYR